MVGVWGQKLLELTLSLLTTVHASMPDAIFYVNWFVSDVDTCCVIIELVNEKLCTYREMGEKYRQEVLSHGGGKPPQAMVAEFLAREVTPHSMVDALMMDLDQKKVRVETALSW